MRFTYGTAPPSYLDIFELFLTLFCIAIAFWRPMFANAWFSGVERVLVAIAGRRWAPYLIVGLLPIALRLVLLPVYGVPTPFHHDEYAYLLQADTFASGRLTNPTPPLPMHFVSIYVLVKPTYAAEYQFAQASMLAAGQKLAGLPWAGVVLSVGILCVLVFWALVAWIPPVWAFIGTLLFEIGVGVLSYWMNSYWGGAVPAIGGALVLGALPRLRERARVRDACLAAVGLFIVVNSRPIEGLLLGLIAAGSLLHFVLITNELTFSILLRRIALPALLIWIPALVFMGYYNYRVTGQTTKFPYLLYRSYYGTPQGFYWQKPFTVSTSMPSDVRAEYEEQLKHATDKSVKALIVATAGKVRRFWDFYIGVPMTVVLIFLPFIWCERNMGLALLVLALVLGFDNLMFFAYFPHYSAAATVAIVLAITQCIRRMRRRSRAGFFLSRSLAVVCVIGLFVPIVGRFIGPYLPARFATIAPVWNQQFNFPLSREQFVPWLERQPGKQLVIVRYQATKFNVRGGHMNENEWVYNRADIENAKIVWARESEDPESNRRLVEHFSNRKLWLGEPDAIPQRVIPYARNPADAGIDQQ